MRLPKGTIVKLQGLPFELKEDVEAEGDEATYRLLERQCDVDRVDRDFDRTANALRATLSPRQPSVLPRAARALRATAALMMRRKEPQTSQ